MQLHDFRLVSTISGRLQDLSLKLEVTPFCSRPFVEVSTDVLL